MKTHKQKKSQDDPKHSLDTLKKNSGKRHVKILRGRFPFQDLFGYLKGPGAGFGHSRGN